MPGPVWERFGWALPRVIAMPDVREHLTRMGLTVGYQPQAQFAGMVRKYTHTLDRIIKASGFQPR